MHEFTLHRNQGAKSKQINPLTSSTNFPVSKSSTPSNKRVPVALVSFPVAAVTGPEALKFPIATLKVPAIVTVKVPWRVVKVTIPWIVNTGAEPPVMAKFPTVVPCSNPPPII